MSAWNRLYTGLWVYQFVRAKEIDTLHKKPVSSWRTVLFWHNSYSKILVLLEDIVTLSCALFACLLLPGVCKVEIAASTWSSINFCYQQESDSVGERGKDYVFLCSRLCFLGVYGKRRSKNVCCENVAPLCLCRRERQNYLHMSVCRERIIVGST